MKTCTNCGNAGKEICKDCIVGNPPSLWQPTPKETIKGDRDRRGTRHE